MAPQVIKNSDLLGVKIAVFGDFETPLFLAKDVAAWIGHTDVSTMVRNIDEDERLTQTMFVSGQSREMIFLTENGVYEVLMQSRKPIAKEFKKGVKEILKSIRKHGGYLTPEKTQELIENPDLIIELATALKQERERTKALAQQNQKMQAKSDFVDRIIDNDEKIDIGQAAKVLALPFGRNTLFQKLREKGVFFKNKNEPKQEYIDRGYFELKEKFIERHSHAGFTVLKVLVTQKGLAYIHKLFPSAVPESKVMSIQ